MQERDWGGKGKGKGKRTTSNELNYKIRHQAALRIMDIVLIPQPLLRLSPHLILLSIFPVFRQDRRALSEMLGEVLCDQPRFGDDDWCRAVGGLDRDYGRLAQGVHFLELGTRELGLLVPVEDLDGVGDVEGDEEPEDALGAGLFEPGGDG